MNEALLRHQRLQFLGIHGIVGPWQAYFAFIPRNALTFARSFRKPAYVMGPAQLPLGILFPVAQREVNDFLENWNLSMTKEAGSGERVTRLGNWRSRLKTERERERENAVEAVQVKQDCVWVGTLLGESKRKPAVWGFPHVDTCPYVLSFDQPHLSPGSCTHPSSNSAQH